MKKIGSIIVLVFINVAVVFASGYFVIKPGVEKVLEASKIQILTEDEIAQKKEEAREKSAEKKQEINDKYDKLIQEEKDRVAKEKAAIKEKYDKQIEELENSRTKQMGEDGWFEESTSINHKIGDLKHQSGVEQMNVASRESDLESEKRKEISAIEMDDFFARPVSNNKLEKGKSLAFGIAIILVGAMIIILDIAYFVSKYNKLAKLRNHVNSCWAQIEVMLKKRYDLIPNLVNTVKGYSSYEKDTLEEIVSIRGKAMKDQNLKEQMDHEKQMSQKINQLFLLNENYPKLMADKNYLALMNELRMVETDLANRRDIYNSSATLYKNARETVPTNLIANVFAFEDLPFYTIEDNERQNVKVEL